jgi:hypothetical protein
MSWKISLPKENSRTPKPSIEPELIAQSLTNRLRHSGTHQGVNEQFGTPRPVFVVGTLRSGVSLLTLSMSQHENLVHVLDTNWFEQFGMGLQNAFGLSMRYRNRSLFDIANLEIEDFFAYFGESINRLMLTLAVTGRLTPDPNDAHGRTEPSITSPYQPTRWIDGTPSNAFGMFVLLRLFPHARFIHVIRELDDVVDILTTEQPRGLYKSHYLRMPEDDAYRHWIGATQACFDAERAFGSNVVTRIRRNDLILAPETTLRRCFEFIDEPFSPLSLRPFSSVTTIDTSRTVTTISDEVPKVDPDVIRALRAEAKALEAQLFAETPSLASSDGDVAPAMVTYAEDLGRIAAFEMEFSRRAERGESAIPTTIPGFAPRAKPKRKRGARRALGSVSKLRTLLERTRMAPPS